jgi:uncharacterized protein
MATALNRLITILREMESAVIAYSGGVDSTFLVKAAALSGIRLMAVTGVSPAMPRQDFVDAEEMAKVLGIAHTVIKTSELEKEDFRKNPPDRCFHCKNELFTKLGRIAESQGYRYVLEGSNVDDLDDWRPGRRAALAHGVRSPLIEAGLRKQEIRDLSLALNLPTWDKPSSPCLSSRFPYGELITAEALAKVGSAEDVLRSFGFREFRVRHHGETARIEIPETDIPRFLDQEIRIPVTRHLRALGYRFVTLDLEGFRSGRLNEAATGSRSSRQ